MAIGRGLPGAAYDGVLGAGVVVLEVEALGTHVADIDLDVVSRAVLERDYQHVPDPKLPQFPGQYPSGGHRAHVFDCFCHRYFLYLRLMF